jgi:hypothetical protein
MVGIIKCKLCDSEMLQKEGDVITCKCGEVTLDGINKRIICQKRASNYIEVDDEGHKIVSDVDIDVKTKPDRQELLDMLSNMINSIDKLPPQAMGTYVTHYDLFSALMIVSELFRSIFDPVDLPEA